MSKDPIETIIDDLFNLLDDLQTEMDRCEGLGRQFFNDVRTLFRSIEILDKTYSNIQAERQRRDPS